MDRIREILKRIGKSIASVLKTVFGNDPAQEVSDPATNIEVLAKNAKLPREDIEALKKALDGTGKIDSKDRITRRVKTPTVQGFYPGSDARDVLGVDRDM